MRVGVKVGPFYLSSSSRGRSRRRGPTAAQRRAQAARQTARRAAHQRHLQEARSRRLAVYGPFTPQDPRTWHATQTVLAVIAVLILFALPAIVGDGPVASAIWAVAVVAGLVAWAVWVIRRHIAERPARAAAREQQAAASAAAQHRAAEAHAAHMAYLAPMMVAPNAWHHGACTINHRTEDTARRCTKGGT